MPTIGPGSFILIVVVALLIFGPKNFPSWEERRETRCGSLKMRQKVWLTTIPIIKRKKISRIG